MKIEKWFMLLFPLLFGCGQTPTKMSSKINLKADDSADFTYNFSPGSAQTFEPEATSELKGVKVEFAPGALAVDAQILIAVADEGVPIPSGTLREGQPYAITAAGSGDLTILSPMSITLPLPLMTALHNHGNRAVAYKGYSGKGESVSGVITDLDLESDRLTIKTTFWGNYQIIRFAR